MVYTSNILYLNLKYIVLWVTKKKRISDKV
jgi:hypothetical protein